MTLLSLVAAAALALEGQATGPDQTPLEGALVQVLAPPGSGVHWERAWSTRVAPDGSFDIPMDVLRDAATSDQEAKVLVSHPGLATTSLHASELTDGVVLALGPSNPPRVQEPIAPPRAEIELDGPWTVPALSACGTDCTRIAFEADQRTRAFLVVVELRDGAVASCDRWIETRSGKTRSARCRRAHPDWASDLETEFRASHSPFFARPGFLTSDRARLHGAPAVFVAACTEDYCHDLLRSYPEDAFLAEVLVGAFEAAGAARSWPFPAP